MAIEIGIAVEGDCSEGAVYEEMGVDALWVGSHLANHSGENDGIVKLGRLSAVTSKAKIGTSVINLPLYHPSVMAKQIADLDVLSGGRVQFGIGIGGEHPAEFRAVNIPINQRGARTDEAIQLIRDLWTGRPVTHRGRYFQVEDVQMKPTPLQEGGPPIIVAGRKEPAMVRAVTLGDGWLPYLYSADRYRRSVKFIREKAESLGRDLTGFGWYVLVFVCIGDTEEGAQTEMAARLTSAFGQDFAQLVDRVAVSGTAGGVAEKIQAFVDAGARHIQFGVLGEDRERQVERLLAEVAPNLSEP